MKRETPNAKRRLVSISPSSKNHMTATIRRGFALLIENGLTQGAIGRISYKIEVDGGAYKGVTARRESNDYGVMETKIDKYEFTASFVGEGAKDVEVAVAEDAAVVADEQVAEADTLTAENAPDYRDKEILITMHCPIKGHKVARLVSMGMFSIPDYNAADGWEYNMITEDEGKRVKLIKQWIDERANEQHESNLEFVKYEIVKEGVFAERDLNGQLRLEAEKHDCEPAAEVAAETVMDIQEAEEAEAEGDSMNEEELTAGKEQINTADAMVMDFLWNLAREEDYQVFYRWKNYGCNDCYKADKGKVVFIFDGPDTMPDVKTEKGKYCFGSYVVDEKTGSLIDRLHQLFNLRVERGYKIPADGPDGFQYQCSSWGPVLSMDIGEMLMICQQAGRSKRQAL